MMVEHRKPVLSQIAKDVMAGVILLLLGGAGSYAFSMLLDNTKRIGALEIAFATARAESNTRDALIQAALARIETKVDGHMAMTIEEQNRLLRDKKVKND